EQRRQICNDRQALVERGFSPTNFAYPLATFNATSVALVRECGYNSARKVGGLRSGAHCGDCPFAERIPPLNPYVTRTPRAVLRTTSLPEIQSYVTQAESNGGGWIQLVFHNICNSCNENAISADKLSALLGWLRPRAATNGTVVRTVGEVMGRAGRGGFRPVPPGATVADTVAPKILRLSMTRKRFAVARFRTPVAARLRRGTTFRYILSEPGKIAFRIQRALRRRGTCRRRCTRYRTVGTLRRRTTRLPDVLRARLRFSGRIGRRPLRRGRYRVVAIAADFAGNRSRPRVLKFAVGRR
ncbi:MAG: hypothetical protein M3355_10105, partial [Actinomycetota bacterium]|nr:hypothetical protein [Actinomycetota bacterium]